MKAIPLGKRNATFQVLESLRHNRNSRHREKRFIVEGVKPLKQLQAQGWPIASLLVREGALSPWARQYVESVAPTELYEVSLELWAELSTKEENSEILAVASLPELPASGLSLVKDGVYVIADRPNSPGNLGSLIRTAEAFGAQAVLTYGHAADFFDQKCISASIGALFSIPLAHIDTGEGFKAWAESFKAAGIPVQVLALDEKGDVDCGALELKGASIVVVGNETDGLSKIFKESCDIKVRIKMKGRATSLNAACSGSILLYELLAR